jgi:hypothetical protein
MRFGSLAVVAFILFSFGSVSAQEAKLVEAAKKEGGKAVVYGSIENDTMDLISAAFKKRTGLEVEFWRAASTKVMDRVLSEYRAGKPLYDVALTITPPMEFLINEGSLVKYDSSPAKAFPKEMIHPNLGPQYRNSIIGVVYHAGIIKPAEAPKSLEEICSSPSIAANWSCRTQVSTRRRLSGSPACTRSWGRREPINSFAIWRRQNRCWSNH